MLPLMLQHILIILILLPVALFCLSSKREKDVQSTPGKKRPDRIKNPRCAEKMEMKQGPFFSLPSFLFAKHSENNQIVHVLGFESAATVSSLLGPA